MLVVVVLALASCGGNGDDDAERAATSASGAESPAVREVTARIGGRTLSGHCRGARRDAPAVVLESGIGNDQGQLWGVEEHLAQRTVVCAYDRAGVGKSDPPPKSPRPVTDVVADLDDAVMFDEDCGGATDFCGRILPSLTRVTKSLADVGERGRFVRAKGAGHDIFSTNLELVQKTVDDVLKEVAGG